MDSRKFIKLVLGGTAAALLCVGGITVVLDPFFIIIRRWKGWNIL